MNEVDQSLRANGCVGYVAITDTYYKERWVDSFCKMSLYGSVEAIPQIKIWYKEL